MTPIRVEVADREEMAALAARLTPLLGAGDVLLLTGNLGAGKTTFAQFLGRALGVRGRVSSPTFTIAREHPARGDGPGLVHVDAYRLAGPDEFGDLGLEPSLDGSVAVIEWGRGMAEALGDHLDVEILRRGVLGDADAQAGGADDAGGPAADDHLAGDAIPAEGDDPDEDEGRTVLITVHGPAWDDRREALQELAGTAGPGVDATARAATSAATAASGEGERE